ncbi:hypothetical protein M0813_14473 [Anaeramoeba flamelloides]|uniref:PH domain-containing protein n=1 Tax=Anaeramoeba flamelloides TaxID=1746091 RepID=A0ABQ8Z604_9EUKA|nr:hypothetical protein M0813_14473 [Anaeramoeba flamelloides]
MTQITKKTNEKEKSFLNLTTTYTNTNTNTNTNTTPNPNTETDTIQIDDYLETHFSLSEHLEMFLGLLEELLEMLQKKDQSPLGKMFEKIFKMNKLLKKESTVADYSIKTFCPNHDLQDEESLLLKKHFENVSKSVFNLLSYSTGYSKGLDHFYVQIETVKEDIELNLLEAAEKISDFIELVEVVELELNKPKNKIDIPIKIINPNNNNNSKLKTETQIEIEKEKDQEQEQELEQEKEKDNTGNEITKQKLQLDEQIITKRRSISCDSKNTNNKQTETKYSSFHEFPISENNYNLQSTLSKVSERSDLENQQNTNTKTKTVKANETETENSTSTGIENMNRRQQANENSESVMKQIPYKPTKPLEYSKSFIKVYFHATSFTTLPLNENESVEKVVENLKKKKYIKNIDDYVFVEKIGNMERILDPQIKPYFLKEFWDQTENGFCRFEYKPKGDVKNPLDTDQKRLVRVYFLNNGYITMLVKSNTTCLDLMKKIHNKFRVKLRIDLNKYSLYIKEDPVFCSFSTLSKKNLILSKKLNFNKNNINTNNNNQKKKKNNKKSKNKNKNNNNSNNNNNNNSNSNSSINSNNSTLKNTTLEEENYSDLRLMELDENMIECINSYELNSKKILFIFKENQTHAPRRTSVYWGKMSISLDKVSQLKKEMGIEKLNNKNNNNKNNNNNNNDNDNDKHNNTNFNTSPKNHNLYKSFSFDNNYNKQKTKQKKSIRNNRVINTDSDNFNLSDYSDSEHLSIDMGNVNEGDETCACFLWLNNKWHPKILSLQGSNLYYFDNFQTLQKNYQIISLTNAQLTAAKKKQFQFQKRKVLLIKTQLNEEFKISFSSQSNFNQWKKKVEGNIVNFNKEQENDSNENLLNNTLHMKIAINKKEMQIHTFKNWINHRLAHNNNLNQSDKNIGNLQTDLQDGVALLSVLESITREKINFNYRPNLLLHKMKNLKKFFDSLRNKGIELAELNEEAIYDGNLNFILDLIWILIYQIENKVNNKNHLFNWIKTQIYKVSDIAIHDFVSFKNPDLLLFLIHSLKPLDFPYPTQYLQMERKEKFHIAFEHANKLLSIPKLILLDDILNDTIDERSIITYLYCFQNYSNF